MEPTSGTVGEEVKYGGLSWSKYDPKEKIYRLIKSGARVLDVGCATGVFGKALKKNKNCIVHGIEINKNAASCAAQNIDAVYNFDLNDIDKSLCQGGLHLQKFDYITFIDCLEHCVNPQHVLEQLKELLSPGALVIVSLPNIANYKIRLDLLLGRFRYKEYGIMDETHLRFFTLETAGELIRKAGFSIVDIMHTAEVKKHWRWLPRTLVAVQFIIVAKLDDIEAGEISSPVSPI